MFTTVGDVLKMAAGAAAGVVIASLCWILFYEGLNLPLIGHVIGGRVQAQVDEARQGLVDASKLAAAQAKLAEAQRQQQAASIALEEYRKRSAADDAVEAQKDATREQEIRSYEIRLAQTKRSCLLDGDDVRELSKPR